MAEKLFINNPKEIISRYTRPISLTGFPAGSPSRIAALLDTSHEQLDDLGKAIKIATDPTLNFCATDILAVMMDSHMPQLPPQWVSEPETQRTVLTMTSKIEIGLLTAQSVWEAVIQNQRRQRVTDDKILRLQILCEQLQAPHKI